MRTLVEGEGLGEACQCPPAEGCACAPRAEAQPLPHRAAQRPAGSTPRPRAKLPGPMPGQRRRRVIRSLVRARGPNGAVVEQRDDGLDLDPSLGRAAVPIWAEPGHAVQVELVVERQPGGEQHISGTVWALTDRRDRDPSLACPSEAEDGLAKLSTLDPATVVKVLSGVDAPGDEADLVDATVRVAWRESPLWASPRWNEARRRAGLDPFSETDLQSARGLIDRRFARATSGLSARLGAAGIEVVGLNATAGVLSVRCRRTQVERMGRLPGVVEAVEKATGNRDLQSFSPTLESYVCTGSPNRYVEGSDVIDCTGGGLSYLDARASVMGVRAFQDQGYQGESTTVGIYDNGFDLLHPAWNGEDGETRVLSMLASLASTGELIWSTADTFAVDPWLLRDHGTQVAGIITGDVAHGQDPDLVSSISPFTAMTAEEVGRAHSGFAPRARVRLYVYEVTGDSDQSINYSGVSDEFMYATLSEYPVDVLNLSVGGNGATEDGARGLSGHAKDANEAFVQDGVLLVKSAGNVFVDSVEDWSAISGPAASCFLSVGALVGSIPSYLDQDSKTLAGDSSGTTLPDGRTWPSLVALTNGCGTMSPVAHPSLTWNGTAVYVDGTVLASDGRPRYNEIGATSGAAPHVSGAALLLKEQMRDVWGDLAEQPGVLLCNLLNMADRYVGRSDTLRPQPRWGLGRFRLRDFTGANGARSKWVTTVLELDDPGVESGQSGVLVDLNSARGSDGSLHEVPRGVRRLDVVVWWDERNTAADQTKAAVDVYLIRRDPDVGGWHVWDRSDNDNGRGGEQVVSLTFDNCNPNKPGICGGAELYLFIDLTSAPCSEWYGRSRQLYVSAFWSTAAEPTDLHCDGSSGDEDCGSCSDRPLSNADLPIDLPFNITDQPDFFGQVSSNFSSPEVPGPGTPGRPF